MVFEKGTSRASMRWVLGLGHALNKPMAAVVITSSSRFLESAWRPLTPVAVGGLLVGDLAGRRVLNAPASEGAFAERGRIPVALMAPEKHTRLASALCGLSFSTSL